MAKFGKQRFHKSYQQNVGWNARSLLHENSKELTQVLIDNVELKDLEIFEFGSGGCRNLYYIWEQEPTVKLHASDLFKEESLKHTNKDIKDKVSFIEGDTEDLIRILDLSNIDLFIFSDHLMHLQYEKVESIFKSIKRIQPKYILLREVHSKYENKKHPRLFHDYDSLNDLYDVIYSADSKQTDQYFIKLLQLK